MTRPKLPKPPKGAERAGPIERADAALGTAAAAYRDVPAVRVLRTIAGVADQPPLFALSALTLVVGAALRDRRLTRTGARMLLAEAAATAAKAVIKHRIARTRPGKMLKDGRYGLHVDRAGTKDDSPWNSFPSGHTAGAVAVGRAILRDYPEAAPLVAGAIALVGGVQPFTGAHFPGDVVAGAALGWTSEALVARGMAAIG
jgi:membrane-associated phospholipid phosphatase